MTRLCQCRIKSYARQTAKELVRLLTHLGLPADFPKFKPAAKAPQTCGPPDEDCQPDPKSNLYEAIDPAPADD